MKNILSGLIGLLAVIFLFSGSGKNSDKPYQDKPAIPESFLIKKNELKLAFHQPDPARQLSFQNYDGNFKTWKEEVRKKFIELTGYEKPGERFVKEIRKEKINGITYHAVIMMVSGDLSIPAYVLEPEGMKKGAVMAIHGHGSVEPMIGLKDDYHHKFAFELARDGYTVIAPELRGFSTLNDLAADVPINRLDYWQVQNSHYSLVTDGWLYGKTLVGETLEDLVAWEDWFFDNYDFKDIAVAGISYGGDLAIYYPVFSDRVSRIFSSGSLGSFSLIFLRCYNAPAHGIPGVLKWIDRSDIAGLNAPRPVLLHYGELDFPSETNTSAAYNESVEPSVSELREIYAQEKAADKVILKVSKGKKHEMDIQLLKDFISGKI